MENITSLMKAEEEVIRLKFNMFKKQKVRA